MKSERKGGKRETESDEREKVSQKHDRKMELRERERERKGKKVSAKKNYCIYALTGERKRNRRGEI